MAERETRRIDQTVLDEPHVSGHRISVRQIHALVEEGDEDPEAVADRYGLSVADVYHALAYYHDNPDEMRAVEDRRDQALSEFRQDVDRPDGVDPDVQ